MSKEEYVCKICKSKDVAMLVWINPNTNQIRNDIKFRTENLIDWCNKCNDSTEVIKIPKEQTV